MNQQISEQRKIKTNRRLPAIAVFAMTLFLAVTAHAQPCSLRVTGAIANCQGASVIWSSATPNVAGYYLQTYAGRFPSGQQLFPLSQRAFLIPSGCGSGGAVRLVEVLTSGAVCTLDWTGNLPHARPCSQCGTNGGNQTTIVSSANFRGNVSRNSLASIFPDPGTSFTDQSQSASSLPLPTTLAGVTVEIDGALCPLVAVTPGQINFLLPDWLAEGPTEVTATIRTTRGSVGQFFGRPQLNPNAPGVFTLSANGTGAAASVWLVIKPSGQHLYYAPGNLRFEPSDTIVLVLYGTGINESVADLILGNGQMIRAQYTGNSWMPGVQQMNFILSPAQLWTGTIGGFVRVTRSGLGFWDSQGFDLRR